MVTNELLVDDEIGAKLLKILVIARNVVSAAERTLCEIEAAVGTKDAFNQLNVVLLGAKMRTIGDSRLWDLCGRPERWRTSLQNGSGLVRECI